MRYRKYRSWAIWLAAAGLCAVCAGPNPSVDPESPQVQRLRLELGRELFSDPRLSEDGTISCASCHDLEAGGDDGLAKAVGLGGAVGPLNTPTVFNSGLNVAQFWDGRAPDLQAQVHGPIANPTEMGAGWGPALNRLRRDRALEERFHRAYPDGLTPDNIAHAIAVFERSLLTLNSPFDLYQRGEREAISEEAIEGWELFQELGCISCHQGRAFGGNMFETFGIVGDYFGARDEPVTEADLGRFNVTGRQEDKHRFKVPGLRNVAETAPYFHDGSAATLADAVRVMSRYQIGRPVSDEEVERLVAFLESLTGSVEGGTP